jgi:ribosomal protein S9
LEPPDANEAKKEPLKFPVVRELVGEILVQTELEGQAVRGGGTVAQGIISAMARGALDGDLRCARELFDRLEGRPRVMEPAKAGGVDARDAMELRLSKSEEIVRERSVEESPGGP